MDDQSLSCPPVELLELATSYQRSKTLFALVELGVPTLLAQGASPLMDIANALGLHPTAADRFLNACLALGLLEFVDGLYRNTALTERFLVQGKPTYLGDQCHKYDERSYALWGDLVAKLRIWHPGSTENEVPQPDDQGRLAMKEQHNLSLMLGHSLGRAYDFTRHALMLDLGGGTGAVSIGICRANPELRSIVFDLPGTSQVAREYIRDAGLHERIDVCEGNFKKDELPRGFDIALLANLLSVADEETNHRLLRNIYELLPDGGVCILSGWILDDSRTSPLIPVLFCLEDINWQAPDVERTESTYRKWLEDAGFVEVERTMYCSPTSMMVARKAKDQDSRKKMT